MNIEWEAPALACFVPCLSEELHGPVIQELRAMVADLKTLVGSDRIALSPVRIFDETDSDYQKRCDELLEGPRGRGRPKEVGAGVLVNQVRELMVRHGCRAGVARDEVKACNLETLVCMIHELGGSPFGAVNWRTIAARAIKPLWIWEVGLGLETKGMDAQERKHFNSMLRHHEVRPPTRKKGKS